MKGKRLLILGAAFALGLSACANSATMVRKNPLRAAGDLELTFNLASNPGNWPTTNSATLTNYTYSLDDTDYTFSLKNVKCNSGYLMCTATAALGLPAISNKKLTKVVAFNSGGCSTSTKVGISSSDSTGDYVSGGEIKTWSTTSSSYSYALSGTSLDTSYFVYVTNKNAQITKLVLSYSETETISYSVEYNANGGSGNMTDLDSPYVQGTTVTVMDNAFTRFGHNFVKWNTKADGSGVDYDEGDTFTINGNTTLYAQWEEDPTVPGTSSNPYTVSQARAAIDAGTGLADVYVTGIITQIDSYNSTYSSITYWISDDGINNNALEVYGGLGNDEHQFTSVSSIELGATVVVKGTLKKYNSTYELDKNNVLISYEEPQAIPATGIELDKSVITVIAGDEFKLNANLLPAGAVGNITWESSDENIALVDEGNVEATGVGTATISATVEGVVTPATCVVTVVSSLNYGSAENPLNISEAKVTLDATGADLSADQLYVRGVISKSHYDSGHSNYVVWLKSDDGLVEQAFELYGIVIDGDYTEEDSLVGYTIVAKGYGKVYGSTYELTFATIDGQRVDLTTISLSEPELPPEEKINKLDTRSALSYNYSKTEGSETIDTLDYDLIKVTGTTYTSWEGKSSVSDAVYAGQSAGGNSSIQLRATNPAGIVTTTSGGKAVKVAVEWNSNTANSRTIDIYGSHTAYASGADLYSASTQGTKLGSIEKGNTQLLLDGTYEYVGIRSNSGALYLDSVKISWGTPTIITYSDVAIRFGGFLSKTLWDDFKTESGIQGYGVELTSTGDVDEDFFTELTESKPNPSLASAAQKAQQKVEDPENPYYVWNLYVKISNDDLEREFTAKAYIKDSNGDKAYFKEVTFSAKTLAKYLLDNSVYGADEFDGSLSNLANL